MSAVDNTPSHDEFRPVVLRVLADGNECGLRELRQRIIDDMQLPAEVLAETIPSGSPRWQYRISWAVSGLVKAGLVERPRKGYYRITADGSTCEKQRLKKITDRDLRKWPAWNAYQEELAIRRQGHPGTHLDVEASDEPAEDPILLMESGAKAYNLQTETELRKHLQSASPEFFEKAVIDLLWAMGYGGAHGEKQHVGRTGDGGIDGVIRQDALGLTNVYIQAKRYADTNKVSDPEIRNFIGSLDSQGATLGVFITSSGFQPKAVTTANNYRHGKIVLIDGIRLTRLMLSYGVGVRKKREYVLYDIDDDFFEDELE